MFGGGRDPTKPAVFDDETEAAQRQEVARLADEFQGTFGQDVIERFIM